MKTAAKLDDFAHDICVSGLGIAFLTVVGIALTRPDTDARRLPRNDVPAPLSWTEAWTPPIVADSMIHSSEPRIGVDHTRAPEVSAVEPQPVGGAQRILLAGESAGAGSSAAR